MRLTSALYFAVPVCFAFAALGCGVQTYNSSSGDPQTYGSVTGDVYFQAANAVFRSKCSACHQYHSMSASELQAAGLVVAASLANSPIYARLKGAGVGGNETMPATGSISADELIAVRNWILNFTP